MVSCRAFPRQTAFDPVLAYRFLRSSTISSTPLSTFSSRQSLPSNYTSIAQHYLFSTISRQYAVLMVKVPKMAKSISEGTLSSFSKQVGDHVEQDEEIASIKTDNIDVSVNALEAGVIRRFMVSVGDTVTVGQDVARIEPGAEGSVTAKDTSEVHNKLTSMDRPASLEPELKKEEFKEEPEEETPPQPKQEEKPVLSKQEEKSIPPQQKKNTPLASKSMEGEPLKATGEEPPFGKGSRREARVRFSLAPF
jgi:2-oxoglutarate dehydrogenase E2 component (dihydrolipoamide succinyltransferase)